MTNLSIGKTVAIILALITLIIIIAMFFGKLYPQTLNQTDIIGKEFFDGNSKTYSRHPFAVNHAADHIVRIIKEVST